ncbi:hypothetical protein CNBJ0500 [Cryptococcus deneoformans B-3501A]|uniref:GH16 domain-containing protein n=1 Tax=Cryptococcus deneoformans (strain JEC21 / ATCC MYA-565) TaxID=214684 RepID=Q5KA54_CRYD1|nr:conserved hypothetical protein [Cryptococcus neoformans var. neoformans JEC21]XP_773272.1 hypothetical protein CNBJ0500 [Cryptococcus neoformans var. neoformans B-3501A]AAW46063.1 conserved hypothetical protein [Cryptococcus neoformans var. neoformans JEC21]EAL18625.1 hypothetical protein CNBJ0500 [Cryptococcus neoformans var. neoformans B-3501A]
MLTLIAIALSVTIALRAGATVYPLVESWHGKGFFDGFTFPVETYDNTTNGDTFWATPANTSLLYTTSTGATILKVDNRTFVPYPEKRYAPRLLSKSAYDLGTVWVMDAVHLPYGCSVWPAFWTQGPSWPAGGEIDIIEGINLQATNMIALHTSGASSCTIPTTSPSPFSGTVSYPNCDNSQNYGSGCTVYDRNTNSYGREFAEAGGGVYVAEFAKDGIRVWFMTRSAIPTAIQVNATQIDTSTLGTPVAEYPSSSCDIANLFGPQTLTINIALCGDYAGLPSELQRTCPALVGDATCYTTYVINDGSTTYAQAYFEINYVNVYSSNPSSVTTISPSGPTSTSTLTSTSTTASTSAAGTREGGATKAERQLLLVAVGSLVSLFLFW